MESIAQDQSTVNVTSTLTFHDKENAPGILKNLQDFYRQQELADLTLTVQGQEFHCHRCVLACVSPYFKAMFSSGMIESVSKKVSLSDVDPLAVGVVLDYIYTSQVTVKEDNVHPLIHASCMFQMDTLFKYCCSFLKGHLNPLNCFNILQISDTYTCDELREVSKLFILQNFCEVCETEEFLQLNKDSLVGYLSDEDLIVQDEERLCNAIIKWVEHDSPERSKFLARLMKLVNVTQLERHYVDVLLQENDLVKQQEKVQQVLENKPKTFRGFDASDSRCENVVVLNATKHQFMTCACPDLYEYDTSRKTLTHYGSIKEIHVEGEMSSVATMDGNRTCLLTGQDSLWYLESIKKGWVKMRTNIEHYGGTVVTIDEQVYVIENSGTSANILSSEDEFDWHTVTKIPKGNCYSTVVVLDEKLYIVGGQHCPYNQCYDPASNTWEELRPPPLTFSRCPGVVLNSFIYIIGVYCPQKKEESAVLRYDPSINEWCQVANLVVPGKQTGAVTCNGVIYSFSTSHEEPWSEDKRILHIQSYNFSKNVWSSSFRDSFSMSIPDHGMCFLPYKHYRSVKILMEKALENL
ncbi:kelch repeat and BTB domain-containing protein 8-like [Glandiceps talaboti]